MARGREALEAAKHEVEALGGEAMMCSVDVADADAVEAAARDIDSGSGRQTSGSTMRWPRAQPVPPIFQPEVAATAIMWAADHRKREVYVGMPP